MNRLLTFCFFLGALLTLAAEEPQTIADHINASSKAVIIQPVQLNERLMPKLTDNAASAADDADKTPSSVGGYRIQLLYSNNARTAQTTASSRAAAVNEQFPEYATYVTFEAPYWRLRVGDFRSYEDATAALARLKAAYPDYAREMRLVRDKISLR